jgi:ABC-type transport system substrate-binding protein
MSEKKYRVQKKDLKKPIIGGGLIVVIAIAGIVSGIVLFTQKEEERGTFSIPYFGLWAYDTLFDKTKLPMPTALGKMTHSVMVINQIAEGLFEYEITDEYTSIIPNLALGCDWSSDGLIFTCLLRKGVKFHDGTPFNATSVKWHFDRLHNLINNITYPNIWYHFDGILVLNRTEIIGEYAIRFVLNRPFVPFKAMLCSFQSYILSPRVAPLNDFIDIDTNLIGTGPFKYNSSAFLYDPIKEEYYTVNTTLLPNLEYWDGRPDLDAVVFKLIEYDEQYFSMLSGEIQSAELGNRAPEDYTSNPGFTLEYWNSTDIWYLSIRNDLINATMRKAFSYAFNYTKFMIYAKTRADGAIRSRSPLSKGMLYCNWEDFELPEYDIVIARQYLKEVNWNGTAGALTANDNITEGNEWESLVTSNTPLAIYNFTHHITHSTHNFTASLLVEISKQIGVKINLIPATWVDYSAKLLKSHFAIWGWGPDYNDPCNNINPLYSSKADGFDNWGQVNDSLVQQWMEKGLIERNETMRAQLYYDIQKRLIEVVYPCLWLHTPVFCCVHGPGLRGIDYNLIPYKVSFKDAYFG